MNSLALAQDLFVRDPEIYRLSWAESSRVDLVTHRRESAPFNIILVY